MSTTEPEGPGIETERSAEVTTESGTEISHAEQTAVEMPSEEDVPPGAEDPAAEDPTP
jgi:hypothetical protein